ncbi:MAG: hypothetical protein SFV20_03920 [Sphingopyxis sp.]|nr:hypothetical protein [Sphingopyxis sp.]
MMLRFAATVSTIALLVIGADPAFAQMDGTTVLGRLNRAGAAIEEALAAAEAARLAGQCERRDDRLKRAVKIIEELEKLQAQGNGLGGDPERTRETRARAQAILNAPCPPPAVPPAAATPVAAPEPGQTRTLEDLQIEYAATLCGPEQEAAKQRLLVALQRIIDAERNPARRDRLLARRDAIAARPVRPCDGAGKPVPDQAAPAAAAPQSDGPPSSIMDDMGETAPSRTSLDVLRERLDKNVDECGNRSEFFRLKRELVDEIERRISVEIDPSKLADLRELYRRYSAKLPSECPKPQPEPPKAGPVGQLPADGSPLAAVAVLQQDRRARLAKRAAILVQVYYLAALIPQAGIGVRRDGAPGTAPERFAGQTRHRVNGLGISAGFQTKLTPEFDLTLGGSYAKGDAESAINSPATSAGQPVDTGIVYGRLSNGSSGIIAGFGGTGAATVDLEEWGVKAQLGWTIPSSPGADFSARLIAGVDYTHSVRDYDMAIASSGVSSGFTFNFAQMRMQRLEEDYFGLALGGEIGFEICPDADFKLHVSGGPYRVDTRFVGTERNSANFGPVGNRDLTLTFREQDDRWGGRFKGGAAIDYHLSDTLSISGRLRYEYRSDVGAIENPNSGDQVFFDGRTTRLTTQDWQAWDAAVGLNLRF